MTPLVRNVVVAAVLAAVLVAVSVPYARSMQREHDALKGYLDRTLLAPEQPLPWTLQRVAPEACVEHGMAWLEGCPSQREWCRTRVNDVLAACIESQDREAYCQQLGVAWQKTSFGFPTCEAFEVAAGEEQGKAVSKACAIGYRAIANHCRALALR